MDDFSFPPIAPQIAVEDEVELDVQSYKHDDRVARAYFSKSWEGVQDMFMDKIEAYQQIGSIPQNLQADEYKIEALVRSRVAAELKEVLLQVQNAVESTEAAKRRK